MQPCRTSPVAWSTCSICFLIITLPLQLSLQITKLSLQITIVNINHCFPIPLLNLSYVYGTGGLLRRPPGGRHGWRLTRFTAAGAIHPAASLGLHRSQGRVSVAGLPQAYLTHGCVVGERDASLSRDWTHSHRDVSCSRLRPLDLLGSVPRGR